MGSLFVTFYRWFIIYILVSNIKFKVHKDLMDTQYIAFDVTDSIPYLPVCLFDNVCITCCNFWED